MLHGVDISNNNGPVNMGSLGKDFGFAKATEGTKFRDGLFPEFWTAMKDLGMLRGAYLFMDAGADPVTEAQYFVNYVKGQGLEEDDVLAVDAEMPGLTNAAVKSSVSTIRALTGKNVWIYTTYSMIASGLFAGLYDQPLWIANPDGPVGNPPHVSPFPVWTVQQYSWATIDSDVFNGSRATWKALANVAKPALPAPRGVAVKTKSSHSLTVVWDAVAGAASYDVWVTRKGATVSHGVRQGNTDHQLTISGLRAFRSYGIHVAAVNSQGKLGAVSTINKWTKI